MSVDLSPDVWNEIQRRLASGSYSSPDEVLRDALAALRCREQEVFNPTGRRRRGGWARLASPGM